jgi:predicted MFS family arabinose efflux permease
MLDGAPPLSKSTSLTVSQFARDEGHFCPVRWKLLIITSLVAALLNAGGMYLFAFLLNAYENRLRGTIGMEAALLLVPLGVSTLAGIFMYRHTARRRKLQATLTALASLIVAILLLFLVAQLLFAHTYGERNGLNREHTMRAGLNLAVRVRR